MPPITLYLSVDLTESRICPILTLATVPWALPKAPLIPVWSLHNEHLYIHNFVNFCDISDFFFRKKLEF